MQITLIPMKVQDTREAEIVNRMLPVARTISFPLRAGSDVRIIPLLLLPKNQKSEKCDQGEKF
jgi:hypothetical protein